MSLTKEFEAKSEKPAMLSPTAYQALLEDLLANGKGMGKTKSIGGFLMRDINVVTETSAGQIETSKNIKVENAYILLDIEQYPLEHQRGLVVKDMAKNWAGKVIRERDLDAPDYKAPGIWVNKQSAVEFDYVPADANDPKNSERKPNTEAYRVCLPMTQPTTIPVQWDGGFFINTGGMLAIRERDMKAMAEALQSIRDGKATAEDALFSKPGVAKFDIYGMEPGFAEKQYGAVTLKPETKALQATKSTTAKAQAPKNA